MNPYLCLSNTEKENIILAQLCKESSAGVYFSWHGGELGDIPLITEPGHLHI
jgi:hypothetical protein